MTSNVRPDLASQTAPAGNHTQADPNFEQRVIALHRKERELTKREQALSNAMTKDQIADALKKDKAGFLKGFGIELPEDQDAVPDHIKELRALKAELEADKNRKAEAEYRESILSKVKGNDKYELVNSLEAYDSAFEEIKRLRDSGEEFDPLSIFDQIEEATYSQLERVRPAKKLQPWFTPKAPEPAENVQKGYQKHPMDASRTMTSNDRASGTSSEQPSNRLLSREESIRQLAQKYSTKPQGITE